MFYEEQPDRAMRFGDIVEGFVLSSPHVDKPSETYPVREYHIEVNRPRFAAIVTPCCSIGNKTLVLTPLIEVRPAFLKNPYFAADLTNINRRMSPEEAVAPGTWAIMPPEEKEKRLSAGKAYAFLDCFIYAPHSFLPEYTVHRKEGNLSMGYHMIEFGRMHRVECDRVIKAGQGPLETKLLQLSRQARAELRDKIAEYFGRVPMEDDV